MNICTDITASRLFLAGIGAMVALGVAESRHIQPTVALFLLPVLLMCARVCGIKRLVNSVSAGAGVATAVLAVVALVG